LRTVATSASQGWSTREIANGFEISPSSVLHLIDEARDELQAALVARLGDLR
jgi:DNA-directed RNA polymerase specialized sigma24 family protein